jgi:type I restriction enzyme S subunit
MIRKLSQLCEFISGNAWKASKFQDSGMPIIRINNMNSNDNDFVYWQEVYDKKYLIQKGDLLLSLSGTIKTHKWNGPEALLNQRIVKITTKNLSDVNIDWVYYQLHYAIEIIANKGKHALVRNLSINDLKDFEVNIPDIETQNKIVAVLNKANSIVLKKDELIILWDTIIHSLYNEMFGDSFYNEKKLKTLPIDKVCSIIVDCPHSTPSYIDSATEFPCIRTSEIKNGEIFWDSMKYLDEMGYLSRIERLTPSHNDIVFAREGTVGDAAIIPANLKISLGQRVMLFRVNTKLVSSKFFWAFLRSNGCQYMIKRKTIGATVKRINIKDVKNILCPIPSLENQILFENKCDKILQIKNSLNETKERINDLFNSTIQKVFNGELNFNVDIELDALIKEIDFQKKENDLSKISGDISYLQRLVDKLNNQEFKEKDLYDKAKYGVFQLMAVKEDERKVIQEYDDKTKSIKLALK